MIKQITKYYTTDGKEFESLMEAEKYDDQRANVEAGKFSMYLQTDAGRVLQNKHSLDEVGIWEVRGEDPNCDYGGSHCNPYIGTYSGKLATVVKIAVLDDNFWTWGAGGYIRKIDVEFV